MRDTITRTKVATWEDLRRFNASLLAIDWQKEAKHWAEDAREWTDITSGRKR